MAHSEVMESFLKDLPTSQLISESDLRLKRPVTPVEGNTVNQTSYKRVAGSDRAVDR